jgi:hypothetical protein
MNDELKAELARVNEFWLGKIAEADANGGSVDVPDADIPSAGNAAICLYCESPRKLAFTGTDGSAEQPTSMMRLTVEPSPAGS